MHQGDMLRDQALARLEGSRRASWIDIAEQRGREVASLMTEFTSDDIWLALEGSQRPLEPRAMGPVLTRLSRAGVIVATDRVRKSDLPQCHSRPKRIWRSVK